MPKASTAITAQEQTKKLAKSLKKELKKQISQGKAVPALTKKQRQNLVQSWVEQLRLTPLKAQPNTTEKTFSHSGVSLTKPWKNKPCRGCPALHGHLCKCALKRARKLQW